jgi:hypothetical protein
VQKKERMNSAIEIFTYNDLLVFVEKTVEFVKNLKSRT